MKKITSLFASILLLSGLNTKAQTITTGMVEVSTGFFVQIEVSATQVTLTMEGPDDVWLGVGFGVSSMTNGGDIVSYDNVGTGFNDRVFSGIGAFPITDTQDWTLQINTISGGTRTVVATRNLTGSDSNDFTFSNNLSSLNIVWGRGFSLVMSNHGINNRGATTVGFSTLSREDDLALSVFQMTPNPTHDVLRIDLPDQVQSANVLVHNLLGMRVMDTEVRRGDTAIDVSGLVGGMYLLTLQTENANHTKRFVRL